MTGSIEAVQFYCQAFNATSKNCFKASDNEDFYTHAEIVINGQTVLAISDVLYYDANFKYENNMQFWLDFDDENTLDNAYKGLEEKAQIHYQLASCEWCNKMADLTDKFGVRWLLTHNA